MCDQIREFNLAKWEDEELEALKQQLRDIIECPAHALLASDPTVTNTSGNVGLPHVESSDVTPSYVGLPHTSLVEVRKSNP